ncbi:CPCC family cysteine-rich protein, partial [Burkholderia multivorans]
MISIRDLPLRCPCCRSKTLRERGGFEICSVCFW